MTDTQAEANVLALNCGSSSLKFGLYRVGARQLDTLLAGKAESIDGSTLRFQATNSRNDVLVSETVSGPSPRDAIVRIGALWPGGCFCQERSPATRRSRKPILAEP